MGMDESTKKKEAAESRIADDAATRSRGIVTTSIIGIVANVLLAGFKAGVGMLSNSIAIVLDAVNNLSDAASSVITIVGTKLAGKQPDRKHPYGYGRIEYLTNIIIAVIVLWAGITSLQESVARIIEPEAASYDAVTLTIVAVAVAAKIALGLFTKHRGAVLNSGSLIASGTDALMDSAISAATLVAALICIFTGVGLEAWLGAIISLVIIKAGIDMLREVISRIIGERIDSETSLAVKAAVADVPGVNGAYDLMLDDYGPDRYWGSVHVEVPESLNAVQIDALTRRIQGAVYRKCGVILHTVGIYAQNESSPAAVRMRASALEFAQSEEHIREIHGFFVDKDAKLVTLDVVVGFDAPDRKAVAARMQEALQRQYPDFAFAITLDSDISD